MAFKDWYEEHSAHLFACIILSILAGFIVTAISLAVVQIHQTKELTVCAPICIDK